MKKYTAEISKLHEAEEASKKITWNDVAEFIGKMTPEQRKFEAVVMSSDSSLTESVAVLIAETVNENSDRPYLLSVKK
jgi:hypothetical protein